MIYPSWRCRESVESVVNSLNRDLLRVVNDLFVLRDLTGVATCDDRPRVLGLDLGGVNLGRVGSSVVPQEYLAAPYNITTWDGPDPSRCAR